MKSLCVALALAAGYARADSNNYPNAAMDVAGNNVYVKKDATLSNSLWLGKVLNVDKGVTVTLKAGVVLSTSQRCIFEDNAKVVVNAGAKLICAGVLVQDGDNAEVNGLLEMPAGVQVRVNGASQLTLSGNQIVSFPLNVDARSSIVFPNSVTIAGQQSFNGAGNIVFGERSYVNIASNAVVHSNAIFEVQGGAQFAIANGGQLFITDGFCLPPTSTAIQDTSFSYSDPAALQIQGDFQCYNRNGNPIINPIVDNNGNCDTTQPVVDTTTTRRPTPCPPTTQPVVETTTTTKCDTPRPTPRPTTQPVIETTTTCNTPRPTPCPPTTQPVVETTTTKCDTPRPTTQPVVDTTTKCDTPRPTTNAVVDTTTTKAATAPYTKFNGWNWAAAPDRVVSNDSDDDDDDDDDK
jgi:hypothetical protein